MIMVIISMYRNFFKDQNKNLHFILGLIKSSFYATIHTFVTLKKHNRFPTYFRNLRLLHKLISVLNFKSMF